MPTVYLRAEALRLPDGAANADGALAPDADLAISALKECGVNTLLLEPHRHHGPSLGMPSVVTPPDRAPGAWLVTTDLEDCRLARRSGMRSVLISADHASNLQPERCDLISRNLFSAALEIIASESGDAR